VLNLVRLPDVNFTNAVSFIAERRTLRWSQNNKSSVLKMHSLTSMRLNDDPPFFFFFLRFGKIDLCLTPWQALKKSVHEIMLDANVLKRVKEILFRRI